MTWQRVPFKGAVRDRTGGQTKIQKRDYLEEGKLAVIDQGQDCIAGYTDEVDARYDGELPVILFGDHTRVFKYVDFSFALGADGVKVLEAKEPFLTRFLYYYFQTARIPSRGYSRHFKFLKEVEVPKPHPSEQRHIVELLDRADALRQQRRAADALAERVLPALFYQMFGDPYENPRNWRTGTLENVVAEFRYGTSAKCHLDGDGLPVLRIPNVLKGEIDTEELKYAELDEKEIERLLLQHGDILFVRTNGNPDYVGRCAVFDLDDDYLYASYLIRARIEDPEVNPWYVAACLRTPGGRMLLKRHIRTTAGQSNLSVSGLNEVEIPIPPQPLQKQFVERLQALKAQRDQLQTSSAMLNDLFALMLQRAFSGELTAAWREDHVEELLQEMDTQAKHLIRT